MQPVAHTVACEHPGQPVVVRAGASGPLHRSGRAAARDGYSSKLPVTLGASASNANRSDTSTLTGESSAST